jgi:hypothetical protein
MEEGNNGFREFEKDYLSKNFTTEELKYWYENGCWNSFCSGDCNDPTCSKKLVNIYSK